MRSLHPALGGLALAAALLIAHRPAYKGYFSDDDLDNLVMTRQVSPAVFANEFVKPVLSEGNFRPAGHLFYKIMGSIAGLDFRWYIPVLHLLHGCNILLLWFLLRKLGAPIIGAWSGALIFAFHMAAFDALWKPMYVFDVLCATFTLLTLLLYLRGHWVWALLPFWLGYKSKEMIVVLPALLLAWEYLAGERRWKRTIPFAAISALFTMQALLSNAAKNDDYTLRFTMDALSRTIPFYSSAMLLVPYAGLGLLLLLLVRDAKVRWGVLFLFLLPAPLWFLPGRLFSVYLYVPLIGLAVVAAFLAPRFHLACVALFFMLWVSGNYLILRQKRSVTLAAASENKAYVSAIGQFLNRNSGLDAVIHDGGPPAMNFWGRDAAIRWFDARPEFTVCRSGKREAAACLEKPRLAVLGWNRQLQLLLPAVREDMEERESFVDLSRTAPVWVFGEGWYDLEGGYRWTGPQASARLRRPDGAKWFVVRVNLNPQQLKDQGPVGLELLLEGKPIGVRKYDRIAWSERRWPLEPGPAGPVTVTLRAERPYRPSNGDPRVLGAAIAAFGFED